MANPYGGGRSLDAIWQNQNITATAKLVLLCFTKELNFTGQFDEWRFYSNERFSKDCSLTIRCVRTTLNWLVDNGYLHKKMEKDEAGRRLSNSFRLTDKLFKESTIEELRSPVKVATEEPSTPVKVATEERRSRGEGEPRSGGRGNDVPPNSFIRTPSEITPSNVCDYYYDKLDNRVDAASNSHTQLMADPIEKIRFRFKNIQFLLDGDKIYATKEEQREEISQWISEFGHASVDEITRKIRRAQSSKLDWNTDAVVALLAENREQMGRNAQWMGNNAETPENY